MGGTCTVAWEHFVHGADIGVRGIGASVDEAFEQAALALTAVIVAPERVAAVEAVADIRCEAPDLEMLLVDWLNTLIYQMATRKILFGRFRVHVDGCALSAEAWGEPVDRGRHQPAVEIKGATYTALAVEHRDDGAWVAQCVVDV